MDQLQKQQVETKIEELLEVARRNDAIAQLLKFKRYVPSACVRTEHENQLAAKGISGYIPMNWYYLPGVGRYNNFELKFHSDWNWLASAIIEMQKYKSIYEAKEAPKKNDKLAAIYMYLKEMLGSMNWDRKTIWTVVSDYALELLSVKEMEAAKLQARNQNLQ